VLSDAGNEDEANSLQNSVLLGKSSWLLWIAKRKNIVPQLHGSAVWRSNLGVSLEAGPLRLLGLASGSGEPVDIRRKTMVSYFLS